MRYKTLTVGNWQLPDGTSTQFSLPDDELVIQAMGGDDWARAFLAVELGDHVPDDVRDLFDAARGALVYGWFFYPLFRLGEEQLARVAETAARTRYTELGGPRSRPGFADVLESLSENQALPVGAEARWHNYRKMRNLVSHPSYQGIVPPGHALRALRTVADDINALFAAPG